MRRRHRVCPLAMYAYPTARVGVIGIGGLGDLALKFAAAYGCDVTAFTSNERAFSEALGFGAICEPSHPGQR
jgi:uncharacterized zinc-type alcohol dehydrogenase-like protein